MNPVARVVGVCFLSSMAWLACAEVPPPAEPPSASDPALDALLADAENGSVVAEALRCRQGGADDDALKLLRRVNVSIKKRYGANAPQLLPILDLAGEILFSAGRFAEAVAPLERAVAIREPLATASHREEEVALASTLLLLGQAHAEMGNKPGAVASLGRAVQLFVSSLGEDHDATSAARQALSAVSQEKEPG